MSYAYKDWWGIVGVILKEGLAGHSQHVYTREQHRDHAFYNNPCAEQIGAILKFFIPPIVFAVFYMYFMTKAREIGMVA